MSEKEMQSILKKELRLDLLFRVIIKNKKKYIVPLLVAGIVASALALCVPRYYKVKVTLAPEYSSSGSSISGGLSGIASMMGINMNNLSSSDAITPTFYPDLMKSTDFLVPLMDVVVETKDGKFKGKYVDYLTKEQKFAWWDIAIGFLVEKLSTSQEDGQGQKQYKVDPFRLSKKQNEVVSAISANIKCMVDKKTDVISITTTAQDPLVAAQLADTIKMKLQDFITEYRTNKARIDLEHITGLCEKARKEYEKAQRAYSEFADSHQDLVLQSYKSIEENYENEMQVAYNTYSSFTQQKQLAQAKLMERTPAFTTIQNSTVPIKHAGPKRMIFVLCVLFITFVVRTILLIRKDDTITF